MVVLTAVLFCRMAYILQHPTTLRGHDYHKIEENGKSSVGHGHSRSLRCSHGITSIRAAFIHVLGDLLQSLGVMVASIVIYIKVNVLWFVVNYSLLFFVVY